MTVIPRRHICCVFESLGTLLDKTLWERMGVVVLSVREVCCV